MLVTLATLLEKRSARRALRQDLNPCCGRNLDENITERRADTDITKTIIGEGIGSLATIEPTTEWYDHHAGPDGIGHDHVAFDSTPLVVRNDGIAIAEVA